MATLPVATSTVAAQTQAPTAAIEQQSASVPDAGGLAAEAPLTFTGKDAARIRHLLHDWAGLSRYREENAGLSAPLSSQPRIVFYGDSITDHWGRTFGSFFPGKPYLNRGIGGQTTAQMLVRFQQDVVALHPAAVLIMGGINDIAGNAGPVTLEDIENNFRSMVDIAQTEHIRVILASTLPASRLPWRPAVAPGPQVQILNAWLNRFARKRHLVYCNYYPAFATPDGGIRSELVYDGAVHPNDAGYAIMTPIAEAAIAHALRPHSVTTTR